MKSKAVTPPRSLAKRPAVYVPPRLQVIAQMLGPPFYEEDPVLFGQMIWTHYEWLIRERERLRLRNEARLSLHDFKLEVFRPGYGFGFYVARVRKMIEHACQTLGVPVASHGSVTVAREERGCAFEPDDCYTFGHEQEFSPGLPDLALVVDRCLALMPKLPLCAALGFPEVWTWTNAGIVIHALTEDGTYHPQAVSPALPAVTAADLTQLVRETHGASDFAFLVAVEEWADALKPTAK